MSGGSFSDKAMSIVSTILLVGAIAAFVWLWFGYPRPDSSQYLSTADLTPVDVSGLDTKGQKLLDGLKNNAGIPIPVPKEKMGRADPFASL